MAGDGDKVASQLAPLSGELTARTEDFTGRSWVFEECERFVATGSRRRFLLTGDPGTGKSAIAARLVQMSRGEAPSNGLAYLGPGGIFYAHFCQANDRRTIRPLRFVEALSSSLASAYQACRDEVLAAGRRQTTIRVEQHVGTAAPGAQITGIEMVNVTVGDLLLRDAFDDLVHRPVEALYRDGFSSPLVILVDALDEALVYRPVESETLVGLLAEAADPTFGLPAPVRLILTSRRDKRVLRLLGSPNLDLPADAPAGSDEVRDYLVTRLGVLADRARTYLAGKISKRGVGNFLYATYAAADLLANKALLQDLNAHPERVADPAILEQLPEGLHDVYRRFLQRELVSGLSQWEDRYRPVLGILTAAQGMGLTGAAVAEIANLKQSEVDTVIHRVEQYLSGPDAVGRYRPYHQSFRDFLFDDTFYGVYPEEVHEQIARHYMNRYGGGWAECEDEYALAYTPTHLVEALSRITRAGARSDLAHRLTSLTTSTGFLEAVDRQLIDTTAVLRDQDRAVNELASKSGEGVVPALIECALGLAALRRLRLRPEQVFQFASEGDLEKARKRLDSFVIEEHWRWAALLTSAWLAADADPAGARQLLQELRAHCTDSRTLERFCERVDADLAGRPSPQYPLPQALPIEDATALVESYGGDPEADITVRARLAARVRSAPTHDIVEDDLTEELDAQTVGADRQAYHLGDAGPLLGAQIEGPELVSFAMANPEVGGELFRRYVDLHASNAYVQYRNPSLWALLGSALRHEKPAWVKEVVAPIVAGAVGGAGIEFTDCLPTSLLALRERYGTIPPGSLAQATQSAVQEAAGLAEGRGLGDRWSAHKRLLSALAEALAVGLSSPEDARTLLHQHRYLPLGFAGFQYLGCLRFAEAILLCGGTRSDIEMQLGMALDAAQNVQLPILALRATSRARAMARTWWRPGVTLNVPVLAEQLLASPPAPEFAAVHEVGFDFFSRPRGQNRVDLPPEMLTARTPGSIALTYQVSGNELLRVNENSGWDLDTNLDKGTEVRIPDPEFLPLVASRLSAEAMVSPGLPRSDRIRALQRLVPVAVRDNTVLDTVLARLLLAAAGHIESEILGGLDEVVQLCRNPALLPPSLFEHPAAELSVDGGSLGGPLGMVRPGRRCQ